MHGMNAAWRMYTFLPLESQNLFVIWFSFLNPNNEFGLFELETILFPSLGYDINLPSKQAWKLYDERKMISLES